jgi:dethiobiotin synthetase
MQVFITGTDTNIGKTVVASWLCMHSGYSYFKPIQTGTIDATDSQTVQKFVNCKIYPESYSYPKPLSPHIAAKFENEIIDINKIQLPKSDKLIVEGAGGVLVPINEETLMIDLIKKFNIPTIIVSSSRLGTINHTLLTIEALKARNINILGVIMTGELNKSTCTTIEYYSNVEILAQIPFLNRINNKELNKIQLSRQLKNIFQ